jgi:hypothetical protein
VESASGGWLILFGGIGSGKDIETRVFEKRYRCGCDIGGALYYTLIGIR